MRLIVKIGLIISSLLVLPLFLALIWRFWAAVLNQPFPLSVPTEWFAEYGPPYLFWGGVVLAIVTLIVVLLALFWPRPRSLFLNQKPEGQVTVSKKAIENFALTALHKEPYISEPRVTAKLTKHRVRLSIKGALRNTVNAKQQTRAFLTELENELRRCLGIDKHTKIKLRLANYQRSSAKSGQPRVV